MITENIDRVYNSSETLYIDDKSKCVFFSDCHRGDRSWSDDFQKNYKAFHTSLSYYYSKGFTYVEVGDGDELWENSSYNKIIEKYQDIYDIFYKLKRQNKIILIYGNHDIEKKLHYDKFDFYEGIILKYKRSNSKILVLHAHQDDLFNDYLWPLSKFLVQYFLKPMKAYGLLSPLSPAENYRMKLIVENRLIGWITENKCGIIAGHTHKTAFPNSIDSVPYFNCGSCVKAGRITNIEIEYGEIKLVEWNHEINNNNAFQISRRIIAGPISIKSLFD